VLLVDADITDHDHRWILVDSSLCLITSGWFLDEMQNWHALLAPLPAEAVVQRRPVVSPELANSVDVSAIAGWEQLTVEMSAAADGLRHLMVVLDPTGQPISAGDHVLTCRAVPGDGSRTEYTHESIGGRLENDGTFNGTRWHIVRVLAEGEGDTDADPAAPGFESRHSRPTADEVMAIKSLVADILRRAGTK
jgi:hypothetical protein